MFIHEHLTIEYRTGKISLQFHLHHSKTLVTIARIVQIPMALILKRCAGSSWVADIHQKLLLNLQGIDALSANFSY